MADLCSQQSNDSSLLTPLSPCLLDLHSDASHIANFAAGNDGPWASIDVSGFLSSSQRSMQCSPTHNDSGFPIPVSAQQLSRPLTLSQVPSSGAAAASAAAAPATPAPLPASSPPPPDAASLPFTNAGHAASTLATLSEMRRRGVGLDLTLVFENEDAFLQCHGIVLATASHFFHSLLASSQSKNVDNLASSSSASPSSQVHIKNASRHSFEKLVNYAYTGKIQITRWVQYV